MRTKHRKQSRTLRFSRVLLGVSAVLGLLPELVADPTVHSLIVAALPDDARRGFAAIVAIVAFYVRHLRMTTDSAIER